ncbi:ribosomal RNA small subunit methyltransferase I [Alphaproteobacteria bacterium]|nr:ribosomal RNA small subunit methyltransferase I [Alphaproteobacteria bacterium]
MQNILTKLPIKFFFDNIELKEKNALYVVATPIGNLSDITIRALKILSEVDFIICEDTRVTAKLLQQYQIFDKKLIVYNDHSDESARIKVLALIQQQKKIALVSDAGTPLISDPGYKLINFLRLNNCQIVAIPGPSALTASLSISGIACDQFLFLGFLPNSTIQRQKIFKNYSRNFSWIAFESALRLMETLKLLQESIPNCKIAIAKELTKIHEQIIFGDVKQVIEYFNDNSDKVKGELVIIIEKINRNEKQYCDDELEKSIIDAIKSGKTLKDLSQELSEIYSLHKKEIYQIALNIKNNL